VPWLTDNAFYEAFATRALFATCYGGADFGECAATIGRIGDGDLDAWHREWMATADRLAAAADASATAGHRASARKAYIRAATYYRTAYSPLYGAPVDERLRVAFEREDAAITQAAPLYDTPVERVEMPFEDGHTLPGIWLAPAADGAQRPTVVHTNGYDSTIAEMLVAHGPAAIERGYNLLLFDGPGQGRNLIRDGLHLRPDWETVVGPVLDWALERPEVDPDRIVLAGWSLGGYLAPRAAAFHSDRLAALWADPGGWDGRAVVERLPLSDDEKARFPEGVDPAKLRPMEDSLRSPQADPMTRWRLIGRGLWVHGKDTLFDYCADMTRFELSPVAQDIRCPALITQAESDPLGAPAGALHEAISSERKLLIRFTDAEGAGDHCEMTARRLFHQRCYDWLDETLAG
jgi:pimeloyl-ACP methyl ester carboxylesterase